MRPRNFEIGKRWHVASVAILLCLFALQSIHVARVTSSSWDEDHYVFDGYTIMAYGNEAWGGPSQVHRYLSDASVDWGQQLLAVKAYLDKNRRT